ncbi:Phosphoenolpyruvate/pyruvate domain-containing protein [Rhizodiscina lignyota]|uniref:Phosphoenolpyruvate/pyruvate domain-containing protein n=1 Tax=Rhizodiscina lignyota TaxID=1504668 RepID=A0A9P4MAQ1_9PEZI|nr:Phosphoenolpyruvate/pyruvate domain-containing protein [Rhizodiscina lignyota]
MASTKLNATAKELKALHKPGSPVVFANVWDILSASTLASIPSCKALATASYAVAREYGLEDDDLDMETNLNGVRGIAKVATEHNKPLSVDFQDGYGDKLEDGFAKLLDLGITGANMEDVDKDTGKQYSVEEAVARIERVLKVVKKMGVPDFALNARCDTLVKGGCMDDVITRGKQYLAAGATTVFVWGGSKRGVSRAEVERMVKEFDGRLNVSMKLSPDGLNVAQLSEIGVARISVGPTLQFTAMAALKSEAEKMLT